MISKLFPVLLVSITIVSSSDADIDSFVHRSWTMEDGLPQNSIFAIEQSPDGYLWIGTLQGLVRFDGHSFTLFDADVTPGLTGNRIVGLAVGDDGALWIGTQASGLSRYFGGQFDTFTIADGLPSNAMGPTGNIHVSTKGTVWFTTDRGLARYVPGPDNTRGHFVKFTIADGLPSNLVTSVFEDQDGSLWVGTGKGLAYRSVQSNTWKTYSAQFELSDGRIGSILRARDRSLWFGTSQGIVHFNPADSEFTRYPLESTLVFSIVEDSQGTIWAGSAGLGLLRFDGSNFVPSNQTSKIGPAVVRIFEDQEGLIWVGTNGNGIHRLRRGMFSAYAAAAEGKPGPMTHGVLESHNGDIFAATYGGGLLRIRDGQIIEKYTTTHGLPSPTIWSLAETPDGTLWVGTEDGLVRYLDNNNRFELIKAPNAPYLSSERISSLALDQTGNLLIGTYLTKLVRLILTKDGISNIEVLLEPKSVPRGGAILTLLQTSDQTVWVGTEAAGVLRIKDKELTSYAEEQGLQKVSIRTLTERSDGTIWAGTYGSGFCALAPNSSQFTCLTSANGLPDNTIHSTLEDGRGYLWTSSNRGLFRLRVSEVENFFKNKLTNVSADVYTQADGLPATEFNGNFQPNSWTMNNGKLLFPSTNGIALVDPMRVAAGASTSLPIMHIESLEADGTIVQASPALRVPAGSKRLTITYTGINFANTNALRFRFRLQGSDPQGVWTKGTDDRFASYTNIPPGDYTFRVQGALGSGNWQEIKLQFSVAPLAHQTWWFATLIILSTLSAVAGIVWSLSRQRIQRELARLEAQRALDAERSRISRDMHDEIGASLTEITLLSELAQREHATELHPSPPNRLLRIAEVSRSSVDSISEIVWALNPRNDLLPILTVYLREHSAQFLESTTLDVKLNFPSNLPNRFISAELRRNIFLITKECLHNVVKHAQATSIHVRLEVDADVLRLTIRDDGVGFTYCATRGDSPRGNGLNNMARRAEEIDASITINAAPGRGTIVSLQVAIP